MPADESTHFSVNPALDVEGLKSAFARDGRVQIREFLAPGQAEALRQSLLARDDWSLILNVGAKVYDLTRTQRAAMTADQLDKLEAEKRSRTGCAWR